MGKYIPSNRLYPLTCLIYLYESQVYITTLSETLHCTYMELKGQMQRMAKSMAPS